MANDTNDIRVLLDVVRAVAQEGLSYPDNEYDTARYKKLMEVASQQYAGLTGLSEAEVKATFQQEHGAITPKVGVDAAVINDQGEILVLRRADNGAWCVPGGWADVDESPFETAIRETREEAGLDIEPVGYIGISCKTPRTHQAWAPGWVSQVNICTAIKPVSSTSEVVLSHEHTAYKWIGDVAQIDNWHTAHQPLVERAFASYRDGTIIPHLDNY
jgi:8-oxo-dGTP pyrophosphatase MutT (NUDIX family)